MSYLSIPPHHLFKSMALPAVFVCLSIYTFTTIVKEKSENIYTEDVTGPTITEEEQSSSNVSITELAKIEVISTSSAMEIEPEITTPESLPEKAESNTITEPETAKPQEVKNISAPTAPKSVTSSFSHTAMLESHNSVRSDKNLNDLTWSNKLAESAKAWTEVLKGENCEMRHDYNSPYGENIFWQQQSGGDTTDLVSTPQEAVYWWANEEKFYNYNKNTCARGEQCGHYTQLVWADTTEVGCGVSSCISNNKRTDIWVCRYNPPGNIIGVQPY